MSLEKRLVKHNPYRRDELVYQSIPELGIKGRREVDYRAKVYRFDDIDFEGKTVVDWGSDMGEFCREAVRRGAKLAVGLELYEETTRLQQEISKKLGIDNTEFYTIDLRGDDVVERVKEVTGQDSFDIHLFLSVVKHVGFPKGVSEICNELFILESNGQKPADVLQKILEDEGFSKVEIVGATKDRHTRPVLWGRK